MLATHLYTLSLHDALPISTASPRRPNKNGKTSCGKNLPGCGAAPPPALPSQSSGWPRQHNLLKTSHQFATPRSEEHTSELQSRGHLVCRLLLEKKNKIATQHEC